MKRIGVAAALVVGTLLLGVASGGVPELGGDRGPANYTVTALMQETPVKSTVRVTANVSKVLDDYTADSGNVYQQFYVTDGNRRVKVFCSTGSGRVNVSTGEQVRVQGTFQEYYGAYEIYTRCASIRTE